MTDSELAEQLSSLDWGAGSQRPQLVQAPPAVDVARAAADDVLIMGSQDVRDISVDVIGVQPRKVKPVAVGKRSHHRAKEFAVVSPPVAPQVVGGGDRGRRPRDTPPDILVLKGESPAVIALFESMWREAGHQFALDVGRPKASKQDAALGWYMFLQAMRARDAR